MKTITIIILLTIFIYSCNAQEPKTLNYYSVEYVDSLKRVIAFKDSILLETFDVFEAKADTFNYTLEGINDNVLIKVDKKGSNVWVNIIDDYRRMNMYYVDGHRSSILMDSTYSVGSINIR